MTTVAHIISKRIKLRDQDIASNSPKVHLLNGELVSRQYYNLMLSSKVKFIPNAKMSPQERAKMMYDLGSMPTSKELDSFPDIACGKCLDDIPQKYERMKG